MSFSLHTGRAATNFSVINIYSLGAHSKTIGALVIAELLSRFCVEMKFPDTFASSESQPLFLGNSVIS